MRILAGAISKTANGRARRAPSTRAFASSRLRSLGALAELASDMRIALTAAIALLSPVASAQSAHWDFVATLEAGAETLAVEACSTGTFDMIRFEAGAGAAAARTLAARSSGDALQIDGDALMAPHWRAGECLRTRVDPASAARAQGARFGYRSGEYVVLAPERWLWRPLRVEPDSTIRFELPAGWSASVPWPPLPGRAYTHRLGPTAADWPALTAFGRFEEQRIALPGGVLRVAVLPPWGPRELTRIEPVARALAAAYGRLPRADAQILVVPIPGSRESAPWGQAMRGGGSAVHLFVGADAGERALIEDWTATHEFSHLLHPYFGARGRWLGEGLASYYQNVLRARIGVLAADAAWNKIEAGFERGRSERKSDGMTLETASRRMGALRAYMRTYWSGAAYWLESDLALRAAGSSLDAALRDYAACCFGENPAQSPKDFVAGLDRVAPRGGFARRYRRYAALTAFPRVKMPRGETAAAIMRP
jgi:hypothetical protein